MATVPDAADDTQTTDNKFSGHSRTNAGSPTGALTPAFINEVVLDTTNGVYYRAVGAADTDWVQFESKQV